MLFDHALSHARVLASTVKGSLKAVLVNLAGIGDKLDDTSGDGATDEPLFGQLGVVARPRAPSSAGYAEVIAAKTGDGMQPIAARDLRLNKRLAPKVGEVDVVQYNGGFLSLADNAAGNGTTVVLYAPVLNGDVVDKAHVLAMDPAAAGGSVSLVHALGMALLMTEQKNVVLKNAAGDVYLQIDDSGFTVNGNTQVNGSLAVGNVPLAQNVMLAPDLMTWIGQANTVFTTLAGAAGGFVPPIVVPTATPSPTSVLMASPLP